MCEKGKIRKLTLPIIFWLESPGETATSLALLALFNTACPGNGTLQCLCLFTDAGDVGLHTLHIGPKRITSANIYSKKN